MTLREKTISLAKQLGCEWDFIEYLLNLKSRKTLEIRYATLRYIQLNENLGNESFNNMGY